MQDLNKLLRTLSATETHFIRCLKPNTGMAPKRFDAPYVRSRVRAAGSLSALKFLKKLQGSAEHRSTEHAETSRRRTSGGRGLACA